jgi:hypothetical protein
MRVVKEHKRRKGYAALVYSALKRHSFDDDVLTQFPRQNRRLELVHK